MSTVTAARNLAAALAVIVAGCNTPQPHLYAERGQVWTLNATGLFLADARKAHRVAINLPDWQWAGEPYACMPGLAIGPKGEAIVTSNVISTLWRVDPDTLAVSVHPLELDADNDKDVGFASLVFSPEQQSFFAVSQVQGSLWRIDPQLRRGQKIALSEPMRRACGVSPIRKEVK